MLIQLNVPQMNSFDSIFVERYIFAAVFTFLRKKEIATQWDVNVMSDDMERGHYSGATVTRENENTIFGWWNFFNDKWNWKVKA